MLSSSLPLLLKFVSLGLCAVPVLVFSPLVASLSQQVSQESLAKLRLNRIIHGGVLSAHRLARQGHTVTVEADCRAWCRACDYRHRYVAPARTAVHGRVTYIGCPYR